MIVINRIRVFGRDSMSIRNWPETERPRERLIKYGASHLSNAELLAIFLRTGIEGKTALDLARDLLSEFGDIGRIIEADFESFAKIKGLGIAKYCQLKATLEIMKRHFQCKVEESASFTNPELVETYLLSQFPQTENEVFACILLDNKHRLIEFEVLFKGTINKTQVYPRVVAQICLKKNAAAIIFAHNHPSGDLTPSDSDQQITEKLKESLKLIDVRVLDHFIIGKNQTLSMAQQGFM